MAGFLYFAAESADKPADDRLGRLGLGHLAGTNLSFSGCRAGPSGGGGVVLALNPADPAARMPRVGYYPDSQHWQDQGDYWLGYELEERPRPTDLQRTELLCGHAVTLGDGQSWRVPIVRFLPQRLQLADDGRISRTPAPEYGQFARLAERCWQDYLRDIGSYEPVDQAERARWQAEHLSEAEQYRLAVGMLGLNYRLAVAEANLLGLFTDLTLLRALEAIMDVPGLLEMAEARKKN